MHYRPSWPDKENRPNQPVPVVGHESSSLRSLFLTATLTRLLGKPAQLNGFRLDLSLPEQRPYSPEIVDIRPKILRQWLADLPWAHVGHTAQLVFQSVVRSNRMDIRPDQRLRFLEQIRAASQYVGRSLRRHYIGMTFSLPETSREVAALAESLCAEMAIGYKTVVRDLTVGKSRAHRGTTALAIHRSIRWLNRVLLVNCRTYSPCPGGLWSELHQLYEFAERLDIHQRPIEDDSYRLAKRGSISDAYKQIALLALTDPYRFPQDEMDRVYVAVEQWAPLADLRLASGSLDPDCFVVDLHKDEPPARASMRAMAGDSHRILDTSRLLPVLRRQRGGTPAQDLGDLIGAAKLSSGSASSDTTLAYLTQSWDTRLGRQVQRAERPLTVEVITGLHAIHASLTVQTDQMRGALSEGAGPPDPWLPLGSPRAPAVLRTGFEAARGPLAVPVPITHGCIALDYGVGGCRVRWAEGDISGVKVGALLLIRVTASTAKQASMLGVVRWMKQDKIDPLETGVQWLTPNPVPVMVKRTGTAPGNPARIFGLALPKQHLDRHMVVLTPSALTWRPGDELTVDGWEGVRRFSLSTVSERTAAFSQLQLSLLAEREPVKQGAEAPPSPAERFAGLWEGL